MNRVIDELKETPYVFKENEVLEFESEKVANGARNTSADSRSFASIAAWAFHKLALK